MSMHPAEIANEIRAYRFFSNFDEALLLQVSTMVRECDFPAGSFILNKGQLNNNLYFLRSGHIEVLVDSERVNELNETGEVFGEMSVLSGSAVTADIRAKNTTRCFLVSADDFTHVQPSQKDQFQFLLYKIYSSVLTDRLKKTNEKAKMYEITARALEVAKRELQEVTSAQMNFLRSEQPKVHKKVLLIESVKKQQVVVKSAFGGTGVELLIASNAEEAKALYINEPDVIFCDEACSDFLAWCHHQTYKGPMALIQSGAFNFEQQTKLPFVQNVISRNPEDRSSTVRNLLTTLTKILHKDFFGLGKYLSWGTEVKEISLSSSSEREEAREKILVDLKSAGIRNALLDRIQLAAEEMMMNAIYDAPVDANGKSKYNHLPRTTVVNLEPKEKCTVRYGTDGIWVAVSVEDPFGALTKEVILKYLQSCYQNQAGTLNTEKGGAGRGLHQILESCDSTVFNVRPGYRTEVIGLFNIDGVVANRDSETPVGPQFQFFFDK